jgi:hypothetical protein
MCGDTGITKKLSAPRLNLGAGREPEAAPEASKPGESTVTPQDVVAMPTDPTLQAAWLKMVRHVMANTEDVGERFAEEARRIHYGESKERNIRGQASQADTLELLEEGISVMPLPVPNALKGPVQ